MVKVTAKGYWFGKKDLLFHNRLKNDETILFRIMKYYLISFQDLGRH
jgi:hypothetical protein